MVAPPLVSFLRGFIWKRNRRWFRAIIETKTDGVERSDRPYCVSMHVIGLAIGFRFESEFAGEVFVEAMDVCELKGGNSCGA